MRPCRVCRREIAEDAFTCPSCGTPYPAREKWDGWGYEYKSEATLFGWPLLHISFKYRPNRMPVVAKGIIAIGQFGYGVVTVAQLGAGLICISQFGLGVFVLAQFGLAYSLIAQLGLYVSQGRGQLVKKIAELAGL